MQVARKVKASEFFNSPHDAIKSSLCHELLMFSEDCLLSFRYLDKPWVFADYSGHDKVFGRPSTNSADGQSSEMPAVTMVAVGFFDFSSNP